LLATHLIQDAGHYQKPLQLVSFDMEKAFDRVGHHIIVQALRAFGVPEIMIMAIQHYTLVGYAFVEGNGCSGILITIKTGSGSGGPSFQYLVLNRHRTPQQAPGFLIARTHVYHLPRRKGLQLAQSSMQMIT
jgi:hypothetical protein